MAGGAMIIFGASIVSIRFGQSMRMFKARLALLMLTCGFIMALASLIFKVFAIKVEFWTTTFWMFVGEGIFGVALLMIPSYRRQFISLVRARTSALLSINASNELINLAGSLGNRYALLFAPLSIVQAIGSPTTVFVFAFRVALRGFVHGLRPGDLARRGRGRNGHAAGRV